MNIVKEDTVQVRVVWEKEPLVEGKTVYYKLTAYYYLGDAQIGSEPLVGLRPRLLTEEQIDYYVEHGELPDEDRKTA